ncbi:hypothetical protein [Streptomyces cellostaticus]|uniref:hypothetical protein n=1 Tax=Streptomyces cellostaticus TaxID=67285 RepID=UPI0008372C52|nr:hypothetical protein [Streptomyces cellostaticus]
MTVFLLEGLTVAYTTQSSDQRCLGDIGLVTIAGELSEGEELWHLASDLGGRSNTQEQARWILTQASRARMVKSGDHPNATWTAHIRRRVALDALFANHKVLLTGRIKPMGPEGMSPRTSTALSLAMRAAQLRSSASDVNVELRRHQEDAHTL